jgi:phospholipid/cholesterol/gamma-HCH transport system substrate-binding protein
MTQKKIISLELKVGITAGISLILLAIIIFTVEKVRFGKAGYPIYVSFQFVDAIKPQADVVIGGGVKIGNVETIDVLGERIQLKVLVNHNVKLPKTAKFQILSKGLMGDKYLNVVTAEDTGEYLTENEKIEGVEPTNIDKAFQRFGQVADSIKMLLGDPELKTSFGDMMRNFSSLSKRLDHLVEVNEKNVNRSVGDFTVAAKSVNRLTAELENVTSELEKLLSETNRQNIEVTLDKLRSLSTRLDTQVSNLERTDVPLGALLNDKEMAHNLKIFVRELKDNPWKLFWKQ